jgi:hypothetical protein
MRRIKNENVERYSYNYLLLYSVWFYACRVNPLRTCHKFLDGMVLVSSSKSTMFGFKVVVDFGARSVVRMYLYINTFYITLYQIPTNSPTVIITKSSLYQNLWHVFWQWVSERGEYKMLNIFHSKIPNCAHIMEFLRIIVPVNGRICLLCVAANF